MINPLPETRILSSNTIKAIHTIRPQSLCQHNPSQPPSLILEKACVSASHIQPRPCHQVHRTRSNTAMLMIAFITLNYSLVPVIESLYSSNHCGFDFLVLRSHLLLFFFERKNLFMKKSSFPQDLIPPSSKYIHLCNMYIYTKTNIPSFSPSGFSWASKCFVLTPWLTSEFPTCSVRVCVRIYKHTPTYTSTPGKEWSKYRQNLYLSSCEK